MWVTHWDADAFFASVEQAADRRLRGRPLAVGGGDRGIVCSVSYEARAFGVRTAMPTRRALQLCPDLVLVKGQYGLYEQFSNELFDRCRNLTPYVEQASIDEGYLDFRGWPGTTDQLLGRLRQTDREIVHDLKITVSQGMAANKRVAAIASKLHKPHGFTVVPRGAEAVFLAPLPVGRIPGVGPVLQEKLSTVGIHRIGQLLQVGPEVLVPLLGKYSEELLCAARGEDTRKVVTERAPAESYGRQETFRIDRGDEEGVCSDLKRMLDGLLRKLRAAGKQARTLTVKVKYTDHTEQSSSRSLSEPGDLAEDFYPWVALLLRQAWQRRVHIRLAAIQLSNLYSAVYQTDLFDPTRMRRRQLTTALDALHTRYDGQLKRASLL